MSDYNDETMEVLASKILDVVDASPADTSETLEVLRRLTAIYMSGLCPHCRKSYAKHIRESARQTLAEANQIAASMDAEGGRTARAFALSRTTKSHQTHWKILCC
jgi:hypothetical protein